jgi:2-amino-4-hydroxy-6-hydroxymethyldihydropteridine diphosphokinase
MRRWRPAYVALGSNLADPAAQVASALERLGGIRGSRLVARSRLWVSRPLGPQEQPDFVNAAAGLLTQLDPRGLLEELQALERAMGRSDPVMRWGPRSIDLDLLALGQEQRDEPGLRLPHPGVHERDFVLYPLAELAAELWIPGRGRVRALARRVINRGTVPMSK